MDDGDGILIRTLIMMNIRLLFLLSVLPIEAQTAIDNFSSMTNDRFANDAAFVGAGLDFSGIGRSSQGNGRFATLIGNNIFLTANHFRVSGEVTFFADNNPNSMPIVRTVTGGQQIGTSDLFIGTFDSALPSSIARFDFFRGGLDLTDNIFGQTVLASLAPGAMVSDTPSTSSTIGLNGPSVFLGGVSPSAGFSSATNLTIGTNFVEAVQESSMIGSGAGAVNNSIALLTFQNEIGDQGFNVTGFEADLNGGDSGSPLLTVIDGDLVLLGLGSGSGTVDLPIGTGPTGAPIFEERDTSIFSFTGNYAEDIQGFIDVNEINNIPEPSAFLLSFLAFFSLSLRRSR